MKPDLDRGYMVVAAIPAYNEEATIAEVIREAKKHVTSVIVCDDGSADMTRRIAKGLGATVTSHRKNLGKGAALRSLFEKAKEIDADVLVTLDADGQHDPKEIPRLIRAMQVNAADIVVGSRFTETNNNSVHIPIYRFLGNKILSTLVDRKLSDTQSGFRVYNKKAFASLVPRDNGMGADSEILFRAREAGLKVVEAPVNAKYDVPNSSKQNFVYQTAQIILSASKHIMTGELEFLFSICATCALFVALGSWIYLFQTFMSTGEMVASIMLIASTTTAVGTILLMGAGQLKRARRS